MFMYKVSLAILRCTEYNFENLKTHCGEPKSSEEALRWKLEAGIAKCIHILLFSEIYHWNKIDCHGHGKRNIRYGKSAPVKLRKILAGLMNNSASVKIENERITKLREGIRNAVIYLEKIKEDKNYLNSTVLQHVYEYLQELLELKISQ